MVNITFDKVWKYVMKQRDKAPVCTVCNAKLFDGNNELDNYFYKKYNVFRVTVEERKYIYYKFWEMYSQFDDKSLSRHHVNYAKNIQIPVCRSCHSKIHNGSDPELQKYLPVDKRPKNQGSFDSNIYKPLG